MRKCARGCAATWDWGSGVAARCPSRQQPTQRTARHSCTQWVVAPVRLWPPRLPHCALKPFLDILVSTSYRNRFQIQKRNGLGSSEMVHAPAADLVNPSEMVHGCRCPVFSTPGDNCILFAAEIHAQEAFSVSDSSRRTPQTTTHGARRRGTPTKRECGR